MCPPSRTLPPPHPSRPPQSAELGSPAASHWLSVLHVVGYICQCYSPSSPHPPRPTVTLLSFDGQRKVHSLRPAEDEKLPPAFLGREGSAGGSWKAPSHQQTLLPLPGRAWSHLPAFRNPCPPGAPGS